MLILRIGDKPRQPFQWWQIAVVAVILALIAAGIWFAFLRDGDDSGEADTASMPNTPTAAAIAAEASETPTTPPERATEASATEAQTSGGVIIYTATSSATPTATATLDVTETPVPTRTLRPSATATASTTPTGAPTATNTARPSDTPPPSDTPTRTLPPSATASNTPQPSRTPTITETPPPSSTPTLKPPTATLNPDVISPTPSPQPSPTPTLSPAEMMIYFAEEDGVTLEEPATLYVLYQLENSDEITVLKEIALEADTQVKIISAEAQQHPEQADLLLREVEVLNTVNSLATGWVDVTLLEDAQPVVPHAVAGDIGANLRRGDGTAYRITGALSPGEIALIVGKSTRAPGWYRVETQSGFTGWVSSAAAAILGDTSDVPAAAAPPLPTVEPTSTPDPESSESTETN